MKNQGSLLSNIELIDNIEKVIFFVSLFVIPISILPFPWDLTEYSMSLVLGFFTILILSLELMKLVWRGRTLIAKGAADAGVLLVAASIVISTFTSRSLQTSLYGFDFRLGSGLVVFIAMFAYLYSARGFLKGIEDTLTSLRFLLAGVAIASVISVLSFWGLNILSFLPSFDSLFSVGLPIYSSSRVAIVIWGGSFLLGTAVLVHSLENKKFTQAILPAVSMLLSLLSIIVFSIVQGWEQVVLLVVAAAAVLVVPFMRKRPLNKTFVWSSLGAFALLAALFLLFRIPQFKQMIVLDESKVITQITIDPQVSWKVATSSISESVWKGIVGMGQDTFSIAYNLYRPLTSETILLNTTNFTTANTQLLNVLATRGVLGIVAWLALGFFIGKMIVMDVRRHKFDNYSDFLLVILDIAAVYIYLSSFMIYYTFLIFFLLLLVLTLGVLVRSEKMYGNVEKFVINWGLFLQKPEEGSARPIASSVLAVIAITALACLFYLGRYTVGAVNVLQAETVSAQGRKLLEKDELSDKERADMLVKASNLYGQAVALSPNNDVLHRRAGLIVSQYVEYLAQRYNESDLDDEKEQLFEEIATYIEIVVEESKRATDLNPDVYANWGTRASIYSKLVGLGLSSYTKSSLTALQNAADLNPLNYELYYNAAQLYVVNNDNDSALRTLTQVFSINPDHVPSLVLAGELSINDGDSRQALRYFSDAKDVMDDLGSTSSDVYEYVVKKINELESAQPPAQDEKTDEESA